MSKRENVVDVALFLAEGAVRVVFAVVVLAVVLVVLALLAAAARYGWEWAG